MPRAISLAEIQAGSFDIAPQQREAKEPLDHAPGAGGQGRVLLSLRGIVHPLPLPKGAELISLTTYDGRLVALTSKGPYIRDGGSWEKILASQPDPELA
jgi:hypothetical protein